jgi:hypothetical protein
MAFWNKEKSVEKVIPQRIQRMAKDEIILWMDTSLMHLHRSYDDWRFRGGPSNVIDEYLDALNAMWTELSNRESTK